MSVDLPTGAAVLLSAAIATACGNAPRPVASGVATVSSAALDRAGTLSVSAFEFSSWRDDNFHYLPSLAVTAPAAGRPVLVQRVDFTTDEAGARRLLMGIRYDAAIRIQPGGSVVLVSQDGSARPAEIVSPVALASISATVSFTDDDGQSGVVSAVRSVAHLSDRTTEHPTAEWTVQQFRMIIPRDQPHRYVIHDRDSIYSDGGVRTLAAMGVTVLRTLVQTPPTHSANAW